ncbi:MAG: hypothetical protein MSG64_11785 [Pyrinomonadaceae bacterium MAG19_C2-C3]|nr:hypothetical protein [Pyrinomonadaceae bacterium MAG19_C2-C3]
MSISARGIAFDAHFTVVVAHLVAPRRVLIYSHSRRGRSLQPRTTTVRTSKRKPLAGQMISGGNF